MYRTLLAAAVNVIPQLLMVGGQFEDSAAKDLVCLDHLDDINSVIFNYASFLDVV